MLQRQNTEGHFGGIAATADAVLALGPRGLGAVRDLECGHGYTDTQLENHGSFFRVFLLKGLFFKELKKLRDLFFSS